ncbi:MAG: hypothetical protein F4Y01_07910 [Gammaproteobacteria bacterium]|nr:hypothetical protein [Gammaproteobacteria bacterium]
MNIVKRWRIATRRPRASTPDEIEQRQRESDRRIVMQLSRGNIRLQRGEFVTRADLDREIEHATKLDFDDDR